MLFISNFRRSVAPLLYLNERKKENGNVQRAPEDFSRGGGGWHMETKVKNRRSHFEQSRNRPKLKRDDSNHPSDYLPSFFSLTFFSPAETKSSVKGYEK
uniref:Uncharacterized protein n=1 Tax=Setaria italica TaxID=4555 RepID=K4AH46_SETIT